MGPLLSEKLEKEIRMSISRILPFCLGRIQFRYKASRRSWLIQRSLRGGLYASCGKAGLMVYVTAGLIWRYQQQNSARVEFYVGASSNLHAIRMLRYIWSFVWPCVGNHLDSQPDQKNWLVATVCNRWTKKGFAQPGLDGSHGHWRLHSGRLAGNVLMSPFLKDWGHPKNIMKNSFPKWLQITWKFHSQK